MTAFVIVLYLTPAFVGADDRPKKPATARSPEEAPPDAPAPDATAPDATTPDEDEPTEAPTEAVQTDDDDMSLDRDEPDFSVVLLPTNLRLPRFKSAFRIIHRFSRPLGQGNFGDLAEDLFGFDSAARVAFDYRFGLMRGTQLGVHRNNGKTIQFSGQHNVIKEGFSGPLSVDALVTVEGVNNFRNDYSSAIGVIVSRKIGARRGALYVEPIWVANTNPLPGQDADNNHTFMLGLGGRVAVARSLYLIGEVTPRLSGYKPGDAYVAFGLEKLLGGHSFQINFTNWLGTTLADMARGSNDRNDWFIGFNLTRKFF